MADWFTLRPKDTFGDLLHLDNSGVGVTSSLKRVEDGHGSDTCLQLSNDTLRVDGNITVTGTVTAAGYASASLSDATLITATGTTTPRTLGARFAERVNVRDWGAVGDGVTDDTVAIQAAITYALTRYYGAEVYIPASNQAYRITNTITITKTSGKYIHLCGDGMSSVVTLDNAAVANAFYIGHAVTAAGGSGVRVSDLRVIGASATTVCFRLQNGSATTFTGVATETALQGYKLIGSFGCRWSHCTAYSLSQNFFQAEDVAHHSVFEKVSGYAIGGTTNPAFLFTTGAHFNIVWRSVDFEGMGYFLSIAAGSISSLLIDGSYIESATQSMFNFAGSAFGIINNNWIGLGTATCAIDRFTGEFKHNTLYNIAVTFGSSVGWIAFQDNRAIGSATLAYPSASYSKLDGLTVTSIGNVGIGHGSPDVDLHIAGSSNRWIKNETAAGVPLFAGFRSAGTIASKTIVASGDEVARFDGRGYDGAAYRQAAAISIKVDGTPGSSDMPGSLVFGTTLDGAASATDRLIINNAGHTYPASNNAYTCGASSFRWSNLYSVLANFSGTLTAAGATFSAGVTVSATLTLASANKLALDAGAGSNRIIEWDTSAVARWKMLTDSTAEGGANAGSDFAINRYDDSGSSLGTVLSLTRSSGNIGLNGASFGSGVKVVFIANGTAPSGTPTGGGILYVESGSLKFKGSSGTTTVLGAA